MIAGATSSNEEVKEKDGKKLELPIGYRFRPTDRHPLPADVIPHIHESKLYSVPPNKLDVCSDDGLASIRNVGDGKGFWKKSAEQRTFVCDADGHKIGHKIAFKNYWNYYSGPPVKGKTTRWVMYEYLSNMENDQHNNRKDVKQWTVVRIKHNWEYKSR